MLTLADGKPEALAGLLRPEAPAELRAIAVTIAGEQRMAQHAAALRQALGENAWMEQVIDFGHAKGFFPDADVMPCVFVARRPDPAKEPPANVAVAVIPRAGQVPLGSVSSCRLHATAPVVSFSA